MDNLERYILYPLLFLLVLGLFILLLCLAVRLQPAPAPAPAEDPSFMLECVYGWDQTPDNCRKILQGEDPPPLPGLTYQKDG